MAMLLIQRRANCKFITAAEHHRQPLTRQLTCCSGKKYPASSLIPISMKQHKIQLVRGQRSIQSG